MQQGKITGFFKKFVVPQNRVPDNSSSDDEIIVAASSKPQRRQNVAPPARSRQATASLVKRVQKLKIPQKRRPLSRNSRESSLSSAQSIATPRKTPKKRSWPSSLDGAGDDEEDLHYSSPSSSTRRAMTSVQVPSPMRRTSPTPTPAALPPPPPPAPRVEQPVSRSFSSTFSSLSSVPMGSQSSSRRVMKGGLQAVTNSDSGSAEDSDEELADLSTFIPRKKQKTSPPAKAPSPTQEPSKPARKSARLSDEGGKIKSRATTPRYPLSPPRTTYKHSLLKMVKEKERQDRQDAKVAEAAVQMEEAAERRRQQAAMAQEMDAEAIAGAMADDSDDADRMMQAMARTEALQDEEKFHFFQDLPPKAQDEPFPTMYTSGEPWEDLLADTHKREQACLTGFIRDLAAHGQIAHDRVTWFTRQLVLECREHLCEAYLDIIKASASHKSTGPGLARHWLRDLYKTSPHGEAELHGPLANQHPAQAAKEQHVGLKHDGDEVRCICRYSSDDGSAVACDTCGFWQHTTCYYPQYDGQALPHDLAHECALCKPRDLDVSAARIRQRERTWTTQPPKDGAPKYTERAPGLRYVVQAITFAAAGRDPQETRHVFVDLALAAIDEDVREDADLCSTIEDCFEALVDHLNMKQLDELYQSVRDLLLQHPNTQLSKTLQCRLIASLPATTANTHYLRRRLALCCTTDHSSCLPLTSSKWCKIILRHLKKAPEYQINEKTNYALLSSLVETVDLAIDAGFSSFDFLNAAPTKPKAGLFSKPAELSEEEKGFNAQIDVLASVLKLMASRIKDAGATHLRRTEAKSAIERVVVRLEYSVRTRPRPKRGVFDGAEEVGRQRSAMEAFAKKAVPVPEDVTIVDEQPALAQMDGAGDEQDGVEPEMPTDAGGDGAVGGTTEQEEAVSGTAAEVVELDEPMPLPEIAKAVANSVKPGRDRHRRISAWDKLRHDGSLRF